MKGCGSYEQILKRKGVTKGGLFAFDPSGELGYFERKRMDDQVATELLKKSLAALPVRASSGTV